MDVKRKLLLSSGKVLDTFNPRIRKIYWLTESEKVQKSESVGWLTAVIPALDLVELANLTIHIFSFYNNKL